MMKLTISAAALIAAAALFTVPASADYLGGNAIHQNGKCWKDFGGPRDSRYGTWIECPKAAAGGQATDCSIGQLAWEKQHVGQQFFDHCSRGGAAAAAKPVAASQRTAR